MENCLLRTLKGEIYEGSLNENYEKHGKGKLTKQNGIILEGEFENDLPKGNFTILHSDGSTERGIYENNLK